LPWQGLCGVPISLTAWKKAKKWVSARQGCTATFLLRFHIHLCSSLATWMCLNDTGGSVVSHRYVLGGSYAKERGARQAGWEL
jgi:hypothetical protein